MKRSSEDFDSQKAYLERLNDDLADVECLILAYVGNNNDAHTTSNLRRIVHSIKGTAGGYGFDVVSILAHRMEDLISLVELSEIPNDERIDRLMSLRDLMMGAVTAYGTGNETRIMQIKNQIGVSLGPTNGTHRVLLVDTSEVTLKLCVDALKRFRVDFGKESNGHDALGRLLKEKFDSVIISMHAPMIGATDLAFIVRNINGVNKRVTFSVVTSDSNPEKDPRIKMVHNIFKKDQDLQKNIIQVYKDLAQEKDSNNRDLDPNSVPFKKIYFVDDSEDIHDLVRLGLKNYKMLELKSTTNPKVAAKECTTFMPDVVIMDSQMPDITGAELCRMFKNDPKLKNIPVFFLTAMTKESELKELDVAGGAAIIRKPFFPKSFASKLFDLYRATQIKKSA
ncbi:MAG: hypothetical protein A4S09_13100 [Proteobacteria bacterium SG_bin7]|nr:MAG: hypothetical protein A4S09_13100 [Proteobacteria bacterium SG_bin7]